MVKVVAAVIFPLDAFQFPEPGERLAVLRALAARRCFQQADPATSYTSPHWTPAAARQAAHITWQIIAAIRGQHAADRDRGGHQTLHHLLPNLIPPIDRQFTFSFFTGRKRP